MGAIKIEAYQLFPAKWIWEVFQKLLKNGQIGLYTNAPVTTVKSASSGKWAVHTENKGTINAKIVIHCTNGWMGHLLPELRDHCFPVSEQVMALKCTQPIWREKGFVWHNVAHYIIQRDKDNIVIVGGGRSTIDGSNRPFIDHNEVEFLGTGLGGMIRANDASIYPVLHTDIKMFLRSHFPNEEWPEYEETEWAGVQGYTKDHLPYIGPLEHHRTQFVAAGYNGHGTRMSPFFLIFCFEDVLGANIFPRVVQRNAALLVEWKAYCRNGCWQSTCRGRSGQYIPSWETNEHYP